jgi:hypothetical protein
MFWHCGMA